MSSHNNATTTKTTAVAHSGNDLQNVKNVNLKKTNRQQQQKQPQATICEANEKRKLLKTHRHIAYLLSFLLWALKPDLNCSSPYSHSPYPFPCKLTTPSKRRRPPMTEFEAHSQSPSPHTPSLPTLLPWPTHGMCLSC